MIRAGHLLLTSCTWDSAGKARLLLRDIDTNSGCVATSGVIVTVNMEMGAKSCGRSQAIESILCYDI